MKNFLIVGTLLFSMIGITAQVQDDASDNDFKKWQMRLRGVAVLPNESAEIGIIGGDAEVSATVIPELDFTYFFNKNWAVELILGTSKHNVNTTGSNLSPVVIDGVALPSDMEVDLGHVWLLPPTLTVQYHFSGLEEVRPYLGAGLNYTIFYGVDEGDVVKDVEYDNSLGFAFQAGMDYDLNEKWFLNADFKYILLKTDVTVNASNLNADDSAVNDLITAIPAEVDLNPLLIGVGVGFRF